MTCTRTMRVILKIDIFQIDCGAHTITNKKSFQNLNSQSSENKKKNSISKQKQKINY